MEQIIQNLQELKCNMERTVIQICERIDLLERKIVMDSSIEMVEKKSEPAPKITKTKILMPWTGNVNSACCSGLKVNHGLYTQCDNSALKENVFCKTCHSQGVKNGSNAPNSGTVTERLASGVMDYTDKRTGKKCVSWAQVLKKLNISLEDGMTEAKVQNLIITDEQLIETDKKRGRPKRTCDPNEAEGGVGDESPKKRGRPKKSKKEVETVAGDDLIANLILNLNEEGGVGVGAPVVDVVDSTEDSGELEMEEMEESTEVRKLTIDGVNYLVDEVNTVYDMESQDEIGSYDPETNSITLDGL